MSAKNSIVKMSPTPTRRNVDLGDLLPYLERAAIEDTTSQTRLYTIPTYIREIISQFLRVRDHQRSHGMPLMTATDIADQIIKS